MSNQILSYVAFVSSFVLIMLVVGTINHPNMNYSEHELKESQKSARYMLLLETFIIVSLWTLGASEQYTCFMSWGIILCALCDVVAKITKQEVVR